MFPTEPMKVSLGVETDLPRKLGNVTSVPHLPQIFWVSSGKAVNFSAAQLNHL